MFNNYIDINNNMKRKQPNNKLYTELIHKQLPDINENKKLTIADMRRICKYISSSIFHPTECCLWHGYITNDNTDKKGTYVNFYFKGKKVALHRLLYTNFIEDIEPSEYLKFKCPNKGVCCNIHHLKKLVYINEENTELKEDEEEPIKEEPKTIKKTKNSIKIHHDKLKVIFD